jgi:hypothetical protein
MSKHYSACFECQDWKPFHFYKENWRNIFERLSHLYSTERKLYKTTIKFIVLLECEATQIIISCFDIQIRVTRKLYKTTIKFIVLLEYDPLRFAAIFIRFYMLSKAVDKYHI